MPLVPEAPLKVLPESKQISSGYRSAGIWQNDHCWINRREAPAADEPQAIRHAILLTVPRYSHNSNITSCGKNAVISTPQSSHW